jgi:PKD repeat protein
VAGQIWDWPNQEVVRADESGPGLDTPPGLASDVVITYGHAGRDYEFQLKRSNGDSVMPPVGVIWDFGDGHVTSSAINSANPTGHTYDAAGTMAVQAHVDAMTRSVAVVVE